MEVMNLVLFVGAVWVVGAIGLFVWNVLSASHQHSERLSILPLEDNWHDPRAATRRPSHEGKAETR
jgi:hypothetical protein